MTFKFDINIFKWIFLPAATGRDPSDPLALVAGYLPPTLLIGHTRTRERKSNSKVCIERSLEGLKKLRSSTVSLHFTLPKINIIGILWSFL
jgi:hypothetical protein